MGCVISWVFGGSFLPLGLIPARTHSPGPAGHVEGKPVPGMGGVFRHQGNADLRTWGRQRVEMRFLKLGRLQIY